MRDDEILSINRCKCGRTPEVELVEFYGEAPKYVVRCQKCRIRTKYYINPGTCADAWNHGKLVEKRDHGPLEDEAVLGMLGEVCQQAIKDYIYEATRPKITKRGHEAMEEIEEFLWGNPYMLPYDREYVLQLLWKSADEAKKKAQEEAG